MISSTPQRRSHTPSTPIPVASGIVELRKISKEFPGVRALHDVSLVIEPGEVLGLVGENGAGKSTLIKILGGVYGAGTFKGEVLIAGTQQAFRSTRDARAAGIAVVHQELSLVTEMSIADNLVLGREPSRFGIVDGNRVQAMARDMLVRVLGPDAGAIDLATPVGHLGVGIQQILEIARALADAARVIVLDEPTAALSEREIERLFALIRERRSEGTSFIYISHRLDEVATLCDRVAVMRDGELVGIRGAAAPTDEIISMMTGKELGDVHAPTAGAVVGDPMLQVSKLRVAHPALPDRFVVDGLTFTVHAGEVVALAGAMGAGRTATLSALFGVARSAVTGTVVVDGRPVSLRSPADAIAAGLAFVPEDRKGAGLVLGASVADNLALSALPKLSRLGVVDAARAEHAALARVRELAIKVSGLTVEVATLSGGNQQKVVIGKWLELAPRVLLLDEPTRGVDVGAKVEIYRLIEQLTAQGHAVLLASSDLPEIVRLADRVLVLREGRLAGELCRGAIDPLSIMRLAMSAGQEES
ncbi:MAG: sugar ABC transporter ATP-binding protein [Deltaproteobacteria bacterium]|nr:sugar ABC transporter ATP-binding protein [Deltaproteobacteria bacterium]